MFDGHCQRTRDTGMQMRRRGGRVEHGRRRGKRSRESSKAEHMRGDGHSSATTWHYINRHTRRPLAPLSASEAHARARAIATLPRGNGEQVLRLFSKNELPSKARPFFDSVNVTLVRRPASSRAVKSTRYQTLTLLRRLRRCVRVKSLITGSTCPLCSGPLNFSTVTVHHYLNRARCVFFLLMMIYRAASGSGREFRNAARVTSLGAAECRAVTSHVPRRRRSARGTSRRSGRGNLRRRGSLFPCAQWQWAVGETLVKEKGEKANCLIFLLERQAKSLSCF